MWIQVKRTQASFYYCCSCSLENGDIRFRRLLGCTVEKGFFLAVVDMCVLLHKRKILRAKQRESGCSGSDGTLHVSDSDMNLAL